jgi:diguanylate cyclase (GGDEF)-like protein
MIDVNYFKELNDRFGHAMGDRVLQGVANVLRDNVRDSDIVVRYGGDEFLVVLPEVDGRADVVRARILETVAERNRTNPLLAFPVTLAIGT